MNKKRFFDSLEKQDFAQAADSFCELDKIEQEQIMKEFYYQVREAKMPIAVSILYRKLHDGKTFEDFYKAWMPPEAYTKPFKVGDTTYYHLFEAPTRVINAVSMENPEEIISVGIVWADEKQFDEELAKATKAKSNAVRHDNISEVADSISVKMYKVKADTKLGN